MASSKTFDAKVTKVEELQGLPGVYQINIAVQELSNQYSAIIPAIQLHCGKETARTYKRLHAEDEIFQISLPE